MSELAVSLFLSDLVKVYVGDTGSPLGVWHTLQLPVDKGAALKELGNHFPLPDPTLLFDVRWDWPDAKRRELINQPQWDDFIRGPSPTLWVSSAAGDRPYPPPTSAGTLLL